MRRLAPDDAAERHEPVVVGHAGGEPDRGRDFQGARHLDQADLRPGLSRHRLGAGDEVVGDVLVVGRHDDQKPHLPVEFRQV